MKDSLKDLIERNRSAFDDKLPPETAWQKIESTLPGMRQRTLWHSVAVWRVAAMLFLGLSVYLFVTRTTTTAPRKDLAAAQVEFSDLESFYNSQIAFKVALINDIDDGGEGASFTQDFKKLDAMYEVLREEMKNHPSDKVKDALVLNLLVRIDLLNQQIKRLEDARKPTGGKKGVGSEA